MKNSLLTGTLFGIVCLAACSDSTSSVVQEIFVSRPDALSKKIDPRYNYFRKYSLKTVEGLDYIYETTCLFLEKNTRPKKRKNQTEFMTDVDRKAAKCSELTVNRAPKDLILNYFKFVLVEVVHQSEWKTFKSRLGHVYEKDLLTAEVEWQKLTDNSSDSSKDARSALLQTQLDSTISQAKEAKEKIALYEQAISELPEDLGKPGMFLLGEQKKLEQKNIQLEQKMNLLSEKLNQSVKDQMTSATYLLAGYNSIVENLDAQKQKYVYGIWPENIPRPINRKVTQKPEYELEVIYGILYFALEHGFFWYRDNPQHLSDNISLVKAKRMSKSFSGKHGRFKLLNYEKPILASHPDAETSFRGRIYAPIVAGDNFEYGHLQADVSRRGCGNLFGRGYRLPTYDELKAERDGLLGSDLSHFLNGQYVWTSTVSYDGWPYDSHDVLAKLGAWRW